MNKKSWNAYDSFERLSKMFTNETNLNVRDMSFTNTCKPCEDDKQQKLKEAVEVLYNALREDKSEGSYYHSWQANIAMAFVDEWIKSKNDKNRTEFQSDLIPEIANEAAKNFLNLLISK